MDITYYTIDTVWLLQRPTTNFHSLTRMLTAFSTNQANTSTSNQETDANGYVFVVKLTDGRVAVGTAKNVAIAICSANSGLHPLLPKSHLIKTIVGIKPITEERTFAGVVAYFCKKVGDDKVIAL